MKYLQIAVLGCLALLGENEPSAYVMGSSLRSSLEEEAVEANQLQRHLQGLPPTLAPEALYLAVAIPPIDVGLRMYETPFAIRFVNYYASMWWNCVAVYSDSFLDAITKERPAVVVTDASKHTTANRASCFAQSTATYHYLSIPESRKGFVEAMASINVKVEDFLNKDVANCGNSVGCLKKLAAGKNFDPFLMGHIVAKRVYDYSLTDGYNQLGTLTTGGDKCVVNCRPYRDTTGYKPVNSPHDIFSTGAEDRWEPLLEDNGRGFFYYQEHVAPHVGQTGKFKFLPEGDRKTRLAPKPTYSVTRFDEALKVIDRMAKMDDVKKIQVEQFDDKTVVAGALIDAFIAKTLTDGFVDKELGSSDPNIVLSFERLVHFAQGLGSIEYDSVLIAWKEKVRYDMIRPTTVIKRWGDKQITTWTPQGVKTFPARDFEAYFRVMPHSEYVSGSSCIFSAQTIFIERYLSGIGLDYKSFPITFPTVPAGGSKAQPGVVPAKPVTLSYPDTATMARAGSDSRLDGGMHFDDSVTGAEAICAEIGEYGAKGNFALY